MAFAQGWVVVWEMAVAMYLPRCEEVAVLVQVREWVSHEERVKQREVWEAQM